MEISTKELRRNPGKTLARVSRGQVFVVTYRGKPIAKIVPCETEERPAKKEDDLLFGLWKDHPIQDVDEHLRRLRSGRRF